MTYLTIAFSKTLSPAKKGQRTALILAVNEGGNLPALTAQYDLAFNNAIKTAVANSKFTGKAKQTMVLPAPAGQPYHWVVLAGAGDITKPTPLLPQQLGGSLVSLLNGLGVTHAALQIEGTAEQMAQIGYGAVLRAYRFDHYFTKKPDGSKPTLQILTVITDDVAGAKKAYVNYDALAQGTYLTRDLASEPANILYPESYAQRVQAELAPLGVKVTVLNQKQLEKLKMGALLGVGQGSVRESFVVVLEWSGNPNDKQAPLGFIGKGVTFDTGGISIKPAAGMEDMKHDMAGSATVVGLFKTLALRNAKVNAVGLIGLVENMPDANAQRPGDVVTSMSGQTIEVLNTDAEGRLVLADVIWYAQEKYKPRLLIDLATLTGAVIVALGSEIAGVMGNDENLENLIIEASKRTGEQAWRLPLTEAFDKAIDSKIADMQNISNEKGGGSSNGGVFIQRFVKKGTPWAHIDIAGTAWTKKATAICPEGATGYGVALLDDYIRHNHEY